MPDAHANDQPISVGTHITAIQLPYPVTEDVIVYEAELPDSLLTVLHGPDGRLVFLIKDRAGSELARERSSQLSLENPRHWLIISVVWSLPDRFDVRINEKAVLSYNKDVHVPPALTIADKRTGIDAEDYSSESEQAQTRRRDRLAGFRGRGNRSLVDRDYLLKALQTETRQLDDLLALIGSGRHHHIPGVAARLRLLVADGDPMPLLQTGAAIKGLPLTVFTFGSHSPPPMRPGGLLFNSGIAAVPAIPFVNPVDLDVWLDFVDITLPDGRKFTNRQVITAIGNAMGSHVDPHVNELMDAIRSIRAQPYQGQPLTDHLHRSVVAVGEVALALGRQIEEASA